MRSDGTLWYQGSATGEVMAGSSALVATQFSTYYSTYSSGTTGYGLGCAVKSDGSVWCWGGNSYGQLGNGNTTVTSSPTALQVVTNTTGTTNLTGISKVFVDGYNANVACAINGSGAVWCWGYGNYGALGNGYTFNYPYAKPVVTSGTTQLTGVDQMSVSTDHVCAHKSDGTVWCWGNNSDGQIGQGNTTTASYLYPTQVTSLFSSITQVSVGYYMSCALDNASDVWCWGLNNYGQVGTGSTTPSAVSSPTKVLTMTGGSAFGGNSQVEVGGYSYSYSVCTLMSADGSLWCWGNYSGSANGYKPIPYAEQSNAISSVAILCDNGDGSYPSFIDFRGAFHYGGSTGSPQVVCP
jgi:alpha-tubulin suppressor-like RCC1 family protein